MFLNTKAGQPMTAEKRAMQRRYWVAEDEWKTTPMFVLFPVAPGKQAWDLLIMLQVVYMCLVMPYRLPRLAAPCSPPQRPSPC